MIVSLKRYTPVFFVLFLLAINLPTKIFSQTIVSNTDESKVPPYTLPDPLVSREGRKITTSAEWMNHQRLYVYHLFEDNVYGKYPSTKIPVKFVVREINKHALNGLAIRKQVRIFLLPPDTSVYMDLLVYLPANAKGPVPVFTGYNFSGNHTIMPDTGIFLSASWMQPKGKGVVNNKATDSSRGTDTAQWQLREILSHGYGLAVAYYGDIEPDNPDGWKTGIRTTLSTALQMKPEDWSAIGAWAWGLSRMMDYLEQDKSIDARKVALIGHSRLGKAALWAGASDQRFSIIVSNESGEGGAALSKRWYGETVAIINQHFPHWFGANYKKYNDNTTALPVDQHMLLALMAPRPLYVASAEGDQWSDPKGEFLAAKNANPVYALFNKKGIDVDSMPPLHHPVGQTVRYHIRAGKHDVTLYDWQQYLGFADRYWKK
ncbi:MAG: acetylxylan esterase [Bacteroidota bacterium]